MKEVRWEYPDNFRHGTAVVGDYVLIHKGGKNHEFSWIVSYKGNVIADSENQPARTTHEARRITEAIYKFHLNNFQS